MDVGGEVGTVPSCDDVRPLADRELVASRHPLHDVGDPVEPGEPDVAVRLLSGQDGPTASPARSFVEYAMSLAVHRHVFRKYPHAHGYGWQVREARRRSEIDNRTGGRKLQRTA